MVNVVRYLFQYIALVLAKLDLIDRSRGRRIADLTWPRFLTMFARDFYRLTDIAMVGLAVGPVAIAGLAFASIYWGLANAFSLGISGGTISQVAQRFGAAEPDQIDLIVKQNLCIGVVVTVPFILAYWFYPLALIGLIGAESETIRLGALYLQIISVGLLFNLCNQIVSRTLAGADDTKIAMTLRASGAFLNVVLNVVLIFGFGLGVVGAALGTVLAEAVITVCFALGLLQGRLPIIGHFPVKTSLTRPYFNRSHASRLLAISPPLIAKHLLRSLVRFPLFAVMALLGPTVVAAFEVARRIRKMMGATGQGFSMAASGMVGQELGKYDEANALQHARDVIRFSAVVYFVCVVLVFVFARPLAYLFANDPKIIDTTVPFIKAGALSFFAMGMSETVEGILKAAGDNRWIFYSQLISQYGFLIPITALGVVTPLGISAIFLAMVLETAARMGIIGYRYRTGQWHVVTRIP